MKTDHIVRQVAMLAFAVAFATSAHAEDRPVSISVDGENVAGTLSLPDGVVDPPVVLMLHGFGGTRNEWTTPIVKEGMFTRAARGINARGIATLRIDFRGSGLSDGKFQDMTVEGEVKDALAALAWLKTQPSVDAKHISVMGMSLGGAVATAVAGRTHDSVKSLILWNPGIDLALAFTRMFGPAAMESGVAAGDEVRTLSPLIGAGSITLRGRFFAGLYAFVPSAELAQYHGPVLLAVGTADTIVTPQPILAKSLLAYHHGPAELWTRPVGHDFGIMSEDKTIDELIAKTAEFLKTNAT
jgi:pimeloyl-ACP methyl ester carboxylesterase